MRADAATINVVGRNPSARSIWRDVARRPALAMWCVFVLLIPLYIFRVGLPQPADLLVVVLAPLAFFDWNRRIDKDTAATIRVLFWFTAWVALVNYGWALVLWKWDRLKDFIIH